MTQPVDSGPRWDIAVEVAEKTKLDEWAVKNTITLLEEDNTIPFIARYRKEQTGSMEADKIREVKQVYEEFK